MAPSAVVLDCDGTLADTEPVADHAWRVALAEVGYELTDADVAAVKGRPWHDVWGHYVGAVPGLGEVSEEAFRVRLRKVFVARFEVAAGLFPDAMAVLEAAVRRGIPTAVCSSSGHEHLARVRGMDRRLEAVATWVGREDTDRHKPAPDPYLEAARRLGVSPDSCVAVEDTPVGAAAAAAAGMDVLGVLRGGTAVAGDWPEGARLVGSISPESVFGV